MSRLNLHDLHWAPEGALAGWSLDGIGLDVAEGEFVGLIGPNGSGKSSLLRCIYRAARPHGGTVRVDDEDIWRQPPRWCAQRVAVVLQEFPSDFGLSVAEVAAMGRSPHQGPFDGDTAADRARVSEALRQVALEAHRDTPFARLSGGEKQRALLARALVQDPGLLLLDEPTNHLDLEMRLALTMALQEFAGAVLVVSHDRHLLKSTTDEFLLVADGRIQPFDGDLDDYARWLVDYRARQAPASSAPSAPNGAGTDKRAQRQAAAALRQQLAPFKKQAEKLEKDLGKVHEQLAEVETRLGDAGLYESARKDELREALAEQARLKAREAELEEQWLEALEHLESLQAQLEAAD